MCLTTSRSLVNGVDRAPSQILPFTVGTNGALQAQTGGAVPDDPTQSNPIYLLVESKGKWLYVANQGNNTHPDQRRRAASPAMSSTPARHQLSHHCR